MDYAYGGHLLNSSLQGQMEPKMVCVAQCTSSNLASIFSLQKIKHSEEDSDHQTTSQRLSPDPTAGGVVEMLLMMAGDVEPNPGPSKLSAQIFHVSIFHIK